MNDRRNNAGGSMMFQSYKRGAPALTGFTMVEIVIILAIITLISSIVLVGFPNVSGNINTQKTAQRFALALRQAQNKALAVRVIQGPTGPVVPKAVGIYAATASPTTFIMFADMNLNRVYDTPADILMETFNTEREIRLIGLLDESAGSQTAISLVFTAPSAEMTIYNAAAPIGQSAFIRFQRDGGGIIRAVSARTSGQIDIE